MEAAFMGSGTTVDKVGWRWLYKAASIGVAGVLILRMGVLCHFFAAVVIRQ